MASHKYELADRADTLYESGRDEELVQLARDSWPEAGGALPDGIAEVFRLARVVCVRMAEALPAGDPAAKALWTEVHLFEAHGLAAAVLAGETRNVAGFLLPRFFDLTKVGAFKEARLVLEDMERLANHGPQEGSDDSLHRPFPNVIRRLIAEKRAFSYFAEGRHLDAEQSYREALAFTRPGSRGSLKVRAGRALAAFMGSGRDVTALAELRKELSEVSDAARAAGHPDVVQWSAANLAKIDAGVVDSFVPYEMP